MFQIDPFPRIVFGSGALARLPEAIAAFGRRVLIVTGSASLDDAGNWRVIAAMLDNAGIEFVRVRVAGEPSPDWVDQIVGRFAREGFAAVVGIGGGSALDAAKAVAGLLEGGDSVLDYLEGVGPEKTYIGPATPFIAVPTTAGTGSEATKNAVLSHQGAGGFKKSFRDQRLVARLALVDPDLLASCPHDVMVANGMDAFTQLLEGYVSLRANRMTDAWAWSGLTAFQRGFFAALAGNAGGRADLAYASLISGMVLAQTGLGSVHGLASPLGAFFPIPHGVVCGTLVAEATDINLAVLTERMNDSPALEKYAHVAALVTQEPRATASDLVTVLRGWLDRLGVARLGAYHISADDVARIVAGSRGSSMRTNPVKLTDDEIAEIVTRRL